MKRLATGLLVALAVALGAGRAAAQGSLPLTVGARLDAGIPIGEESDGVETGFGWGVEAAIDLTPMFAIYGAFSQFEFGAEGVEDFEFKHETGAVGGRVLLGTGGGIWTPFGQFGVVFADGDTGFEAGLGADYPVGGNLSLTPLARYRNVDDLQYIALGIGANLRF